MKYVNGTHVFPEKLLQEIQQYIQGECVYIPQLDGSRKRWGEKTGQRKQLIVRNCEIRNKFRNGASIEQLVDIYFLSYETIKKIVYSK